jgi:hypothetical protein
MYQFSPYVKGNVEFLKKLATTKSDKKKNTILLSATAEQILAIVEICANILKFNYTLTKKQKTKLAKYADFYRAIARTRTEKTARRRLQQGSGIALGAILVPILAELATHLVEKIIK